MPRDIDSHRLTTGSTSPNAGNDKQRIFLSDPDRQHFLDLLEQRSEERQVHIAGYLITSNPAR